MAYVLDKQILTNSDMSSDVTSSSQFIGYTSGYSIHSIWTSSPVGTLYIQASNNDSDWITVDSVATDGAASSRLVNVTNAQYNYVRVF
jgi:hypothetical protein